MLIGEKCVGEIKEWGYVLVVNLGEVIILRERECKIEGRYRIII